MKLTGPLFTYRRTLCEECHMVDMCVLWMGREPMAIHSTDVWLCLECTKRGIATLQAQWAEKGTTLGYTLSSWTQTDDAETPRRRDDSLARPEETS